MKNYNLYLQNKNNHMRKQQRISICRTRK